MTRPVARPRESRYPFLRALPPNAIGVVYSALVFGAGVLKYAEVLKTTQHTQTMTSGIRLTCHSPSEPRCKVLMVYELYGLSGPSVRQALKQDGGPSTASGPWQTNGYQGPLHSYRWLVSYEAPELLMNSGMTSSTQTLGVLVVEYISKTSIYCPFKDSGSRNYTWHSVWSQSPENGQYLDP